MTTEDRYPSLRLAQDTWPSFEPGHGQILLVPLGSTEQHGRHLPLGTDTDIAVALADAAARRRRELVVAPALPYGASGEHADFPGTLSIGQEALRMVLVELARSASATFGRIAFVSAHGGNAAPLREAVALSRAEGRDVRAWGPRFGGDAHAGRTETSIQLALAPDRVILSDALPGNTTPVRDLLPELVAGGVRAVSADGVLGDPTGADATEGRALLEAAVTDLLATLDAWWGDR